MTANKGFHMAREPLRALIHAQGQLIHSHKDMLLFFALDTLSHITETAPQLRETCPQGFLTAQKLKPLMASDQARQALFCWDINDTSGKATEALQDLAAACRDDAGLAKQANLAETLLAYLEMAQEIRHPDLTQTFQQVAKINPYTSAAFVAAYLGRLADNFYHNGDNKLAADLTQGAERIKTFQPESSGTLQTISAEKIGRLYDLMDCLSDIADLARKIETTRNAESRKDPRLSQALHYSFITAAVYDWRQYRWPANDQGAIPQKNNILQFKAR